MKIGMVVDNEYHSDVRVKREVRLLKELGYTLYVLCLTFDRHYSYKEDDAEIVSIYLPRKLKDVLYFFMNSFPFYEWWWKRKVRRFVSQNALDVIHTHDLYMSKCVKKGIKASGRGIPMILDLHENYPYAIQSYKWTQGTLRSALVRPKSWIRKEGRHLSYAEKIIVLSEDFKQSLLNRYSFLDEKDLIVFPNVVDTQSFDGYPISDVNAELPQKPRLLYFGMVASRRGIFRTLQSCEKLLHDGIDFSLIIIGPVDAGDKELFFKEISKPVFENHLIYKPWIDLSELPSYLYACDIALAPFDKNPQHESGIANKIFQYMYGKLPIVASNCKPQQELIEKYELGEVFATDDELTEKLKLLIENEEMRQKMGKKAYDVLMTAFHQDAFMPQFKELYEGL